MPTGSRAIDRHFAGRTPQVRATYVAILEVARAWGPVVEEPKKTSIHLVRDTAFAGVATQKAALVLTLKSDRYVASPRVRRHEKVSASRWHLEVRLSGPDEVNAEVRKWLERAYSLSGPKPARAVQPSGKRTQVSKPASGVRS